MGGHCRHNVQYITCCRAWVCVGTADTMYNTSLVVGPGCVWALRTQCTIHRLLQGLGVGGHCGHNVQYIGCCRAWVCVSTVDTMYNTSLVVGPGCVWAL